MRRIEDQIVSTVYGPKPKWAAEAAQLAKKKLVFLGRDFKFWVKAFVTKAVKMFPWGPGL